MGAFLPDQITMISFFVRSKLSKTLVSALFYHFLEAVMRGKMADIKSEMGRFLSISARVFCRA